MDNTAVRSFLMVLGLVFGFGIVILIPTVITLVNTFVGEMAQAGLR